MDSQTGLPPSKKRIVPTLPQHAHPLTHNELLELGILAVEEPEVTGQAPAAPVAPGAIPMHSPVPPSVVVAPQSADAGPVTDTPYTNTSVVNAPQATPVKAPDIAPPPGGMPLQSGVAQVGLGFGQPAPRATQAEAAAIERMDFSANSMKLKNISRLHKFGVFMNILVIILILAILAGGWFLYQQLVGGDALQLFR